MLESPPLAQAPPLGRVGAWCGGGGSAGEGGAQLAGTGRGALQQLAHLVRGEGLGVRGEG